MDLSTTQVYEDEDFPFTQKISHALEEEEPVQVNYNLMRFFND